MSFFHVVKKGSLRVLDVFVSARKVEFYLARRHFQSVEFFSEVCFHNVDTYSPVYLFVKCQEVSKSPGQSLETSTSIAFFWHFRCEQILGNTAVLV